MLTASNLIGLQRFLEHTVNQTWPIAKTPASTLDKRSALRQPVCLPARLTWKDQRGTTRFASVLTRDVSEFGVFVECQGEVSIPLFRLVQFQLERDVRDSDPVPAALRAGRVLSAVYRVTSPAANGGRQGLALRLMVDPRRRALEVADVRAATA